jgi:hypothetical protein
LKRTRILAHAIRHLSTGSRLRPAASMPTGSLVAPGGEIATVPTEKSIVWRRPLRLAERKALYLLAMPGAEQQDLRRKGALVTNRLRARWQSVFRRPPPPNLPRHLLFAVLAFQIEVDRLGDLDHKTKKLLDRVHAHASGSTTTRLEDLDRKGTRLTPGTVLVREWHPQRMRRRFSRGSCAKACPHHEAAPVRRFGPPSDKWAFRRVWTCSRPKNWALIRWRPRGEQDVDTMQARAQLGEPRRI